MQLWSLILVLVNSVPAIMETPTPRTPLNFLNRTDPCKHTDLHRFTLEDIKKDSGAHCDPRQLLICQGLDLFGNFGSCECGLVHATYDDVKKRCIALTGAPCGKNVFGDPDLEFPDEYVKCELPEMECITPSVAAVHNYAMCRCIGSKVPDDEGGCDGWREAGMALCPSKSLLLFAFIFPFLAIATFHASPVRVPATVVLLGIG